ncbi:MAG: class II fructose-bisphosphate aldolase [Sphaerochaetaceae bacterium]|jgi:fructose-bisphosphate aldolase class II|nr:class II fructose-bisphosphate aldolase [Sphaerochaetaceae bacterium]MDD4219325.1 class II fructose-bisphosphate aldolase [Sphaerochaetaceae bacterium]
MLVSLSEMLGRAKAEGYGVPAISAANEMTLRASIEAAEKANSPVIILTGYYQTDAVNYYTRIIEDFARMASVPVTAMWDHSSNFKESMRGIRAGFSSIMVDRSSLPYEENVKQVKEMVRIAHAVDIEVEAELGHVGTGVNYAADDTSVLTVPDEAVKFIEETGADCLAVAIGTAHGVYKGEPKLRFDLLKEIAEKVPVPLVLHGGSGTGDENISKACSMGICKVNVANELMRACYNALQADGMEGNNIYKFWPVLDKAYKQKCAHLFEVCGSAGKAWQAHQCLTAKSRAAFKTEA